MAAPKTSPALAAPDARLIPIEMIEEGERLRQLDPARVRELMVSIEESGLAQPVLLRPKGEGFQLVAGLHRYSACVHLGHAAIPSIVRDLTDGEARLLEIDENLVRKDLTALERIVFVAARLEAWAARTPDQVVADNTLPLKRRGRPPKFLCSLHENGQYVPTRMGFDEETAEQTGLSPFSVRRIVAAAAGLTPALISDLSGTPVANNDSLLRGLAAIGNRDEQAAAAAALIEGRAKTVAAARAIATGHPVPEKPKPKADLKAAWRSATLWEREVLLRWLNGAGSKSLPSGWTLKDPIFSAEARSTAPAVEEAPDGQG